MNPSNSSSSNRKHRPLALGNLRAFEAVARHLSFRKAAQELSLTQPAVTRQIQGLELEVGVPLFLRSTRAVQLTEPGLQLLRSISPSIQKIDASVQHVRQQHHRQSVSITTFASFASMWVIPQLEQFQRAQPGIDVSIDASDHYIDLDQSQIDIALRLGFEKQMPPEATWLFSERLVPMGQARLLPSKGLKQIDQLKQFNLLENDVDIEGRLSWQYWLNERRQASLQPKSWVRLNYTYQILQMALAGQGLLLARLPLMAESVQRGDLIEVFPQQAAMASSPPILYWMAVNRASLAKPQVKALVEWLTEAASQTRSLLPAATKHPSLPLAKPRRSAQKK